MNEGKLDWQEMLVESHRFGLNSAMNDRRWQRIVTEANRSISIMQLLAMAAQVLGVSDSPREASWIGP